MRPPERVPMRLPVEELPGVWRRAHRHDAPGTLYEIREATALPVGAWFDVREYEHLPDSRGGWEWSTSRRVRGDTLQAEYCDDPRCEALRTLNLPHRPPFRGGAPWAMQLSRGARYASSVHGGSRAERLRARAALVASQLLAPRGGLPVFVVARELGLAPYTVGSLRREQWLRARTVEPGFVRGAHPEIELLHVLDDDVPTFRERLRALLNGEPGLFGGGARYVVNPARLLRFVEALPAAAVTARVRGSGLTA